MNANLIMVFITAKDMPEAKAISDGLVNGNLAACVNIVESVTSIFKWEGKVSSNSEVLCIAKSRAELFTDIEKKVKEIHSYEVPEIIAVPVIAGSKDYMEWVENSTL